MEKNRFRFADIAAILFLSLVTIGLFVWLKPFIQATHRWPYSMGFIKLAVLGTFGSMIKCRFKTGSYWKLPNFIWEVIVWGIWGMWFVYTFSFCVHGVNGNISTGLWWNGSILWKAFSKSLAINFLCGYAFSMMLSHEYASSAMRNRTASLVTFFQTINPTFWGRFIPWTLLIFWLPAHTVTFLLPPEFQVIMAAYLAIVLAIFISLGNKKKEEGPRTSLSGAGGPES